VQEVSRELSRSGEVGTINIPSMFTNFPIKKLDKNKKITNPRKGGSMLKWSSKQTCRQASRQSGSQLGKQASSLAGRQFGRHEVGS
jgi:hypothetical protein